MYHNCDSKKERGKLEDICCYMPKDPEYPTPADFHSMLGKCFTHDMKKRGADSDCVCGGKANFARCRHLVLKRFNVGNWEWWGKYGFWLWGGAGREKSVNWNVEAMRWTVGMDIFWYRHTLFGLLCDWCVGVNWRRRGFETRSVSQIRPRYAHF